MKKVKRAYRVDGWIDAFFKAHDLLTELECPMWKPSKFFCSIELFVWIVKIVNWNTHKYVCVCVSIIYGIKKLMSV